jgi:hypothetical protein
MISLAQRLDYYGGTTSIIDFVIPNPNSRCNYQQWRSWAESQRLTTAHVAITWWDESQHGTLAQRRREQLQAFHGERHHVRRRTLVGSFKRSLNWAPCRLCTRKWRAGLPAANKSPR